MAAVEGTRLDSFPVAGEIAGSANPSITPIDPSDQGEDRAPEGVGRRLLKPQTLVSFGLAIGIVAFLFTRFDINMADVWAIVKNANPWLLLAALGCYYGTFLLRAYRWKWMLSQAGIDEAHGYDIPGYPRLVEILLLSWFVNCIIPAKVGDVYRCYLFKRDTGARFSSTIGTILAERLTDLVVLFVAMTGAGILAFHGNVPSEVTRTLLIGVILIVVGLGVLAVLGFARERFKGLLPHRFQDQFEMFHDAIFSCLRSPWRPLAISAVMWTMDGFRLFLVAKALGADLEFSLAVFVALMSALLTTLPITPAGLGVVEAAVIVVLKLVDVEASMAGSIAIVDRLIGYWSLIVVGLVLYIRRLRIDMRAARSTKA